MKISFITLFLIIITNILFAINDSSKINIDTTYIKQTKDLLTTKVYLSSNTNKFEIQDIKNGNKLNYSPNAGLNLGFGLYYKWLGAAFSINLKNDEIAKKGKTEKLNLQLNILGQKNILYSSIQHYSGYYIENPNLYDTTWTNLLNYPHDKNINATSINFSWIYIFNNKKFSYKTSFKPKNIQKKSAGSLLIGTFANYNSIGTLNSILPDNSLSYFSDDCNFKTSTSLNLNFGVGYAYTLVIHKKTFTSLSLMQGLGLQQVSITYANNIMDDSHSSVSIQTQIKFAFGHNSLRNFYGITVFADVIPYKSKNNNAQISYSNNFFKIYYGHRFNFNIFKKQKDDKS